MEQNIPRVDPAAVRALRDKLGAIASDEDDATKMDRTAALLAKTTHEVAAFAVLALLTRVKHVEGRLVLYRSLVAKLLDSDNASPARGKV